VVIFISPLDPTIISVHVGDFHATNVFATETVFVFQDQITSIDVNDPAILLDVALKSNCVTNLNRDQLAFNVFNVRSFHSPNSPWHSGHRQAVPYTATGISPRFGLLLCVLVAATGNGLLGGVALVGVLGMCLALPRWLLFGRPLGHYQRHRAATRCFAHAAPLETAPQLYGLPIGLPLPPVAYCGQLRHWAPGALGAPAGPRRRDRVGNCACCRLDNYVLACPATRSKRFFRFKALKNHENKGKINLFPTLVVVWFLGHINSGG
jgi:hypothetical protein